jgi:hypothetical protein
MSFVESVIVRVRRIEKLLSDLGGDGKGIHERVTQLGSRVPYDQSKRLRYIASVRNKLIHTDGYTFDGNESTFLDVCDHSISQLESLLKVAATSSAKSGAIGRPPLLHLKSAYVWAFFIPVVGIWKGLSLFLNGQRRHGLIVIFIGIVMSPFWYYFLLGLFS